MPLSKERNRDRMREYRLHRALSTPYQSNDVQPNDVLTVDTLRNMIDIDRANATPSHRIDHWFDADGNPVYEE